jgi:hypothetical protein
MNALGRLCSHLPQKGSEQFADSALLVPRMTGLPNSVADVIIWLTA